MKWHAVGVRRALSALKVEPGRGLTRREAARRAAYRRDGRRIFLTPLFLAVVGALAAGGDWLGAGLVAATAALDALLPMLLRTRSDGVSQEPGGVHVLREGASRRVDAADLAPGDLVALRAGGLVPRRVRIVKADGLVLIRQGRELRATREPLNAQTPWAARANMGYPGERVSQGSGVGLVVGALPGRAGGRESLAASLVGLALGGMGLAAALLWGASLPEALLRGAGVALALAPAGAQLARMSLRQALMNSLEGQGVRLRGADAPERLRALRALWLPQRGVITGWAPRVSLAAAPLDPVAPEAFKRQPGWLLLAMGVALCGEGNSADPEERGLLAFAAQLGFQKATLDKQYPRLPGPEAAPADLRVTVHQEPKGQRIYLRGPLERVLERCAGLRLGREERSLPSLRAQILEAGQKMEEQGLTVVGYATGVGTEQPALEQLEFLGMLGLEEEVREGVAGQLLQLTRSGIRPVMLSEAGPAQTARLAQALGWADAPQHTLDREALKCPGAQPAVLLSRAQVVDRAAADGLLAAVQAQALGGRETGLWVRDGDDLARLGDALLPLAAEGSEWAPLCQVALPGEGLSALPLAVRAADELSEQDDRAVGCLMGSALGLFLFQLAAACFRLPMLSAWQLIAVQLLCGLLPLAAPQRRVSFRGDGWALCALLEGGACALVSAAALSLGGAWGQDLAFVSMLLAQALSAQALWLESRQTFSRALLSVSVLVAVGLGGILAFEGLISLGALLLSVGLALVAWGVVHYGSGLLRNMGRMKR